MARGSTDLYVDYLQEVKADTNRKQMGGNNEEDRRKQNDHCWPSLANINCWSCLLQMVYLLFFSHPTTTETEEKNNTTLVFMLTNINCWSCLLQMVYLLFFSHPTTTETEEKKEHHFSLYVNKHKLLVQFVADGILVVLLPSNHHWNRRKKRTPL